MSKRVFFAVLLASGFFRLYGQTVSGTKFRQEGQTIVVNYNIKGARYYNTFNIDFHGK